MKTTLKIFAISFAFLFLLSSCADEEPAAPVITNFELGYDNNKVAHRGDDLHMDAEIVAEGRIDRIQVEIHHEGEHGKKSSVVTVFDAMEWEFEYTWTEFSGLKNTTFHEHIEIPLEAETGDYHFHFSVIDQEGNVTDFETDLEVLDPVE
jgi:hypothetical protein